MARCARLISFDLPMHIMCRGNNRQVIFRTEEEKMYFRHLLHKLKGLNGVHIYHYCLMNNHIHLIIRLDPGADLSRFLKRVLLAYYSFFRNRHGYVGHLFQGRYKSIIIDTQGYLIQCGKYIELNPVRAGLVFGPGDYRYSSYLYYAEGLYDALVTPDPSFASLGRDEATRRSLYKNLFIDDTMINSEKLRSQLYLGSEAFIILMEDRFGIRNVALTPGRPRMPENQKRPHFRESSFIDKTG